MHGRGRWRIHHCMRFDIPFLPDPEYLQALTRFEPDLATLHFSLHAPGIPDARARLREVETDRLIDLLRLGPGCDRLALLNSRLHTPAFLREPAARRPLLNALERLLAADVCQGIVVADPYLLNVLGDDSPHLAGALQAVPSVNARLASVHAIRAWRTVIEEAGFLPPARLVLDRELNRDPGQLEALSAACRRFWPDQEVFLLANEGCLPHCPYKPAHDGQIALAACDLTAEATFELNATAGCVRHLLRDPAAVLRSPFIRPEDGERLAGMVDGLKLCGRNMGSRFCLRVLRAYVQGRFSGNLLQLLDSVDWMAEGLVIDNDTLPSDFWDQLTGCDGSCQECGYCQALLQSAGRPTPLGPWGNHA